MEGSVQYEFANSTNVSTTNLKERNGTIEYLMLAGFILDGGVCGTYNLK
jgi:hypothetical protein